MSEYDFSKLNDQKKNGVKKNGVKVKDRGHGFPFDFLLQIGE
jgi:hypothetical protein